MRVEQVIENRVGKCKKSAQGSFTESRNDSGGKIYGFIHVDNFTSDLFSVYDNFSENQRLPINIHNESSISIFKYS